MENNTDVADIEKGKVVAILSYITFVGWLVAYLMNNNSSSKFGAFHLRQSLGLMIIGVGVFVISFGFLFFSWYLYAGLRFINVGVLVLVIMGIINAANGKTQTLPVVGEFFDKTFSGIK
ncbi:hypothetical protein BH09BAC5_BH09BAC5_17700 [soil metagenome]